MTRRLPPRSTAISIVLVLLAALLAAGPAAAAGNADPVATMSKVARDLGLQTKMPEDDPPERPTPTSNFRWHIPGEVARWILYGALALGAAFVLFALRGSLPSLSRRARLKANDQGGAIILPNAEAIERMAETGADADELARRGLFAEAMHMLLLRSVTEMRSRLDVTIADALTSREILQRLSLPGFGLPDLGRRALAELIQRVELVHFGRRPAAQDDYGACRASFETLVGAMRVPAAA